MNDIPVVADSDREVAAAAAESLAELKDPGAAEVLFPRKRFQILELPQQHASIIHHGYHAVLLAD